MIPCTRQAAFGLVLCACSASVSAGSIDLSLLPESVFDVPYVLVDVDRDGRLDFLSSFGQSIRVQRNLGGGDLGPPEHYRLLADEEYSLQILAASDLNEDDRPDVVVKLFWGEWSIAILLNEGAGSFGAPEVHACEEAEFIAAADVDSDGDRDLVASTKRSSSEGSLRVFRNLGGGRFGAATNYSIGSQRPGPIALADLDLDGALDIATCRPRSYLPNLGNGAFGFPVPFDEVSSGTGANLVSGDLNGDAAPDLVLTLVNTADPLRVFLNQGGARFATTMFRVGAVSGPHLVDLDQDGAPEIVVADANDCTILYNNGSGSFSPTVFRGAGGDKDIRSSDLDTDGRPDLVVTGGRWFTPLMSRGTRDYEIRDSYGPLPRYWTASLFDLDEDGVNELVFGTRAWLQVSPDGSFVAPRRADTGAGDGGLAAADFDLDGILDVTGARGLGGGRFAATSISWSDAYGAPTGAVVGDFDGDGWPDAAFARHATTTGAISVIRNLRRGRLLGPGVPYAAGSTPTAVVAADFDGDGAVDLAANGWSDNVLVLRNTGAGQFAPPAFVPLPRAPLNLAAADFDGDGLQDLAVATAGNHVMLLNGPNGFIAPVELATGYGPALVVSDFDRDGDPDLAVGIASGVVPVRNDGAGAFTVMKGYYFHAGPTSLAAGDLDVDGHPDLVYFGANPNSQRRNLVILAGRGDMTFDLVAERDLEDLVTEYALGDFTGDGKLDLLVPRVLYANRTPGPVPILLEDLQALREGALVRLSWSLNPLAMASILGIGVERAWGPLGTWEDLTPSLLAPQRRMEYTDVLEDPSVVPWYRLLVFSTAGGRHVASTLQVGAGPAGSSQVVIRSISRMQAGDGIEIQYLLERRLDVRIAVHDVTGRRLWETAKPGLAPGNHVQFWSARTPYGAPVASGIYFATIQGGGAGASRRFSYVR